MPTSQSQSCEREREEAFIFRNKVTLVPTLQ